MEILVTPHACRAYVERVCGRLTAEAAVGEIREALRHPLFRCPSARGDLTLWGCLNAAGYPFVAATDPADQGAEFLLVRTVGPRWYWHEARQHWRPFNQGTRRRMRICG